jgi:hypothetical protein
MREPQEGVIEVCDDREWARPHYITAKGVALLHELVAYVRSAMAEMTTPQPTLVSQLNGLPGTSREIPWRFEFRMRDGLTAAMLDRYEAAHDWSLYKNSPFSETKPAGTRRCRNLSVAGAAYNEQRIRHAKRVIDCFDDVLRRAGDTLNGTGWGETKIEGYRYRALPSAMPPEPNDLFVPVTPVPPNKYGDLINALRSYDRPNEWERSRGRLKEYEPFAEFHEQGIDLTDDQILAFRPILVAAGAKEPGASLRGDGNYHVDHGSAIFASKKTMADWTAEYGEPAERHGEIAVFEGVMAARDPEWRPYFVTRTIHVLPTTFGTVVVHAATKQVYVGRPRPVLEKQG